jgi:ribose transport system permease protein/erythritol transport system permease protein
MWAFAAIALTDLLFGGLLPWNLYLVWFNTDFSKDPVVFRWLLFDFPALFLLGLAGTLICWVWWRVEAGDRWQQILLVLSRPLALVVVFLFFLTLVPEGKFASARNLENVLRQSAVYATAALGMTMVIIAAGIDLSIGSVIALAVIMVAWVLNLHYEGAPATDGRPEVLFLIHQYPVALPILAVAAAITVATLAGMLNGMLIVGLRLVPFIVTLGTMMIFRGAASGIADQKDIYPQESTWIAGITDPTLVPWLDWVTDKSEKQPEGLGWLILPLAIWVLLAGALLAALVLHYTRFGRHVFAVGSNEETARLCGVPVGRTKIMVYCVAGFFAGLAGLMQFSYIGGTGSPSTATTYELYVIAAVVIGGGSLMGGEGSILGSVIGALIITILYLGGKQADWDQWVQTIVIGVIIIAAVALDRFRRRRMT